MAKILTPTEALWLRITKVVGGIAVLWLMVSIGYAQGSMVPAVGGNYVEGVVGSPRLVNPLFASLNEVDMDLTRLLYSGLMRYDAVGRLVPDLAVNYEVSPDKKTYTFTLKKDVKWHDGEPFTGNDIVYTIKTIQDKAVGSPLLISFQGVGVEAPDDSTVVFSLPEPFSSFLATLTVGILPDHVWGAIPPDQIRLAQANLKPVGTGPFAFKRLIKDDSGFISRYELTRFANYYRESAYLEDVAFNFFSDYEGDQGALQALRQKKIDGLSFVPSSLREKVKRKHIALHTLQLPQYTALFFNKDKNPALQDKDVRFSLAEGLNKGQILHDSLSGEGEVIVGPILPHFPGFDSAVAGLEISADKANTTLDKNWPRISPDEYKEVLRKEYQAAATAETATSTAGAPSSTPVSSSTPGADTEIEQLIKAEVNEAQSFFRRNKQGRVLHLNLVTADTNEYRKAAALIASYWQEIGVKTTITYVNPKDISRAALKERDYDILLYGVIMGGDPDQYPFWHSSQVDYPGLNLARYTNRKTDDLLQKIRQTSSTEDAVPLYRDLQKIILDDLPAIFLYTPTYTYALSDKINGFDMERIAHPSDRLGSMTSWYVKTRWRLN